MKNKGEMHTYEEYLKRFYPDSFKRKRCSNPSTVEEDAVRMVEETLCRVRDILSKN